MKPMPGPSSPAPCQCFPDADCVCDDSERALRAWKGGKAETPMTAEQRKWALNEIADVEGYSRADYEGSDDAMLAGGVLDAWTDFCRDKGLI